MAVGDKTQPMTVPGASGRVLGFLEDREEMLVDRSIEMAKSNGYTPYTTTIRAAWVEAIRSVTEALGNYLSYATGGVSGPKAAASYGDDPRFVRMRKIARLHRSLGITLPMYLGLFKHFRNIYMDVLPDAQLDPEGEDNLRHLIRDFFDETELSIVADWTEFGDRGRLRELQKRTRALTLEKDRYFAIFESLRDPAFLLDRDRRMVNANQAAAELFLGDAEAGDIMYTRLMRRQKSTLQDRVTAILDGLEGAKQTVWLETPVGQCCFDIRIRTLHDAVENMTIGHVMLLHDITSYHQAMEDAQLAERQKSQFLAMMSHEIRTPLHNVLGATDLLRKSGRKTHAMYLDVIESAGQSLLQTLNNVLDYSKLENSKPVPHRIATNLGRALSAFQRITLAGNGNRCVGLSIKLDPDLPDNLCLDWALTRQVLSNLVSNALRFDDGRGVTVSVRRASPHDKGEGSVTWLRFEVSDHGPGLAPEDAEGLFRPFSEFSARNTEGGGAGLGLAICHNFVEAMGGTIGYDTNDSGSILWFELPSAADSAVAHTDFETAPPIRASGKNRRCLLVDDDRDGAIITTHQLNLLGFEVLVATSMAAALDTAKQHPFDAFVVDYMLPDGDGPTLVGMLRQARSLEARFVALTANVEAVRKQRSSHCPFDRILAKPADVATLGEALAGLGTVSVAATPGLAPRHMLDGLSPETIIAMSEAFEEQWLILRDSLRRGVHEGDRDDLARLAHRLIGSSSFLGLTELERPLRDLEALCTTGGAADLLAAMLSEFDMPPRDLTSWEDITNRTGTK